MYLKEVDSGSNVQTLLHHCYPEFETSLRPAVQAILASAQQTQIPAGVRLFREAERCQSFMWLLEGSVRVFKHSPEGREITLYRVNPGGFCVLTLRGLLLEEGFPAEAIAETDIFGLTMSRSSFYQVINNSQAFHHYLLKILSRRIGDVMRLVSDVTFQNLNCRLACLVGQLFERTAGQSLSITHIQLARELGTTREMVSRILKDFEHRQCIRLSRGKIQLVSSEGLNWFTRS